MKLFSPRLEGKATSNVSVGPRAVKFNVVWNNHGRTQKWDYSAFDQKYPF